MAIKYDDKKKVFYLLTADTEYQFKIDKYDHLLHLYYGGKVGQDMSDVLTFQNRAFSGNPYISKEDRTYSLDVLPQEFPVYGMDDHREPALRVRQADGSYGCELLYQAHDIIDGKYKLEGLPQSYETDDDCVTSLLVILVDPATLLEVTLYYSVYEQANIITRSVSVKNNQSLPISIESLKSASLDNLSRNLECLSFPGRHAMERQPQRQPLPYGKTIYSSNRGTSSHQHNPFIIMMEPDTTERNGNCYGMMLAYSGSFEAVVERSQFDQIRTGIGICSEGFYYQLKEGECIQAPEVFLTCTEEGFASLSHRYHDFLNHHVVRGNYKDKERPIVINNWEATYFNFNDDKLLEIAKEASELGIELFVMDDGWFGNRETDRSSLGDWDVDRKKLRRGLPDLVEKINKLGMSFGIWLEPEMISEESELYRTHPKWAIEIPGRASISSRSQYVLDMTNPIVRDYLFEKIHSLLESCPIAYVKWDMNRSLSNVYSQVLPANEQGRFHYLYVLGLYDLLERVTHAHPDVLIESCSGGGGRFDAGMLYYTPQIWTSDNTDAIDRVRIQQGTSFGYPLSCQASHVSDIPNHQTGRLTSLKTRGDVAMTGLFGYELDLTQLSKEEKEIIKQQVSVVKKNRQVFLTGDYYRLTSSGEEQNLTAWQVVSKDKSDVILTIVRNQSLANGPVEFVKLRGLQPNCMYELEGSKSVYTGSLLMRIGVKVPMSTCDYESYYYKFKQL